MLREFETDHTGDHHPNTAAAPGFRHKRTQLPDVTRLLSDSVQDLRENFAGYCAVGFPAILFGMMWGVVVSFMSFMVVVMCIPIFERNYGDALSLVTVLGFFSVLTGLFLIPLQAGIARAVAAHLDDGRKFNILSAEGLWRLDLGKVFMVQLLVAAMTLTGAAFFLVPALVVSVFTSFALPAVIVHRVGALDAISLSVGHTRANFAWHCRVWALGTVVFLIVSQIPIFGILLAGPWMFSFTLRGYRAAFGGERDPTFS